MTRKLFLKLGATAALIAAIGCGGSTIDQPASDPSFIRAIHLASDVNGVDILAGGATLTTNLQPRASFPAAGSAFRQVDRGETTVRVRATGTTTDALSGTVDFSGGDLVSLIVAGSAGASAGGSDPLRFIRIADAVRDLNRTNANLRIVHAAIGVGNVDVYLVPGDAPAVTGAAQLTNVPRYAVSERLSVTPGTYTAFVTPTGTTDAAIRQVMNLQSGYFVVAAENRGGAALRVFGTQTLP